MLEWGIRWYVLIATLVPAIFLLSSIPIVRSATFPGRSGDPFLLNPDYAFSLKHVNCDIVIYGDSTAVTGIDPKVVSRATGLKACNIAQSQSIFEVLGPLALDTYLQNNTAPKYIVMQFAPETLVRGRDDFFWPEGLTLLLRRHSVFEALPTLVRHPIQTYNFAMWAIKTEVDSFRHPQPDFSQTTAIFQSHEGLLILPKPPQTRCTNQVKYVAPTQSWVTQMRQTYTSAVTKVFIDVSPIPDCAPDMEKIITGSRGVTDNLPPVYPIGLFCDLDRHLTLEGAERASLAVARQILMQAHL